MKMGLERVVAVEKESCFLWGFLEGGGIVLKALSDTGEHKAGGAVGCARALLQGHPGAAAPPGWAPSRAGEHPGVVGTGQRPPGPSWPVPVVPGTSGCCVTVGRCCAGTRGRGRRRSACLTADALSVHVIGLSRCVSGLAHCALGSAMNPPPPPERLPLTRRPLPGSCRLRCLPPPASPGLVWGLQETEETFCASL